MALDPEELKRRRQHRKLQQKAARRKLITRLCIAGGLLLLCGILILVVSLRNTDDTPPSVTEPPASLSPEQVPDTTLPPQTVIRFAATGDLNVTERMVSAGDGNYEYSSLFLDVAYLLADADLATVNLEGNFCGAPYGSSASAPPSLAQALRRGGVDMIQLANSYAIHRGVSGLVSTIDCVRQAGMEPVGVFRDQADYDQHQGFSLFEVQGVRVAVVSFTKGMDGTTLPPGNESCVNVLYSDYDSVYQKIDKEKIGQILDAVNEVKPDVTIALLHWGSEYNDTISSTQKSIKNLLLEQGVDAIIGTHPHYVQQIVFDPEAGTLVAYSLGDFVSDVTRAGTEYSIILELEITKDHTTGVTTVTDYSYTPIFSVVEEGKPTRILRIREAMAAYEAGYMDAVSKETYDAMAYALQRIDQRIAGE